MWFRAGRLSFQVDTKVARHLSNYLAGKYIRAAHSTYRRPETCNQDAPGAACSVLTLLADINTGEPESSEWDLVLLPDFSLTVSVSHSVHSVGASNCSLGSTGQKNQPNKQTVLAPWSCTAACTAHALILCKRHTHQPTTHLSPLPLRCVAVAVAAPASAPAPALLLCLLLHLHQIFLVSSWTASHLFPPGSQNPRSPCPVGSIIRWCDFFFLPHLYFPVVTWTRRKTGRPTPTGH